MIQLRIILGASLCLLMLTSQLAMAQPAFILAGDSLSDSLCHQPGHVDTLVGQYVDLDGDGNADLHFRYYSDEGPDYYDREHYCNPASGVAVVVSADTAVSKRVQAHPAGDTIGATSFWVSDSGLVLHHAWHDDWGGSGYYGAWHHGTVSHMGVRIAHGADTAYCWALVEMQMGYNLRWLGTACRCDSTTIGIEDAADTSPLFWYLQDDLFFIGGLTGSESQVELYDMLGRRLLTDLDPQHQGTGPWSTDVSQLPPGQYVAQVIGNQGMRSLLWRRH